LIQGVLYQHYDSILIQGVLFLLYCFSFMQLLRNM